MTTEGGPYILSIEDEIDLMADAALNDAAVKPAAYNADSNGITVSFGNHSYVLTVPTKQWEWAAPAWTATAKKVPVSAITPPPVAPEVTEPAKTVPPELEEFPRDQRRIEGWAAYNAQFPQPVLTLDEHGWATPLDADVRTKTSDAADVQARRLRDIAAAFGDGTLIGHGRSRMPKFHKLSWLQAFHNGDLATCYRIEARFVDPGANHPGHPDRPETHRIIWAEPASPQIPAGQAVPGDWPAPIESEWPGHIVANYLIAARAQKAELMAHGERTLWVCAHLRGDRGAVGQINDLVAQRVPALVFRYSKPEWYAGPHRPDRRRDRRALAWWSTTALREYAAEHQLPYAHTHDELREQVRAHQDSTVAPSPDLQLTPAQGMPALSGYHPKHWLRDKHGRTWLFKPAPSAAHRFRADTEHAAHQLARAWGFPAAESHLVTHDGQYGQLQAALDIERSFHPDPAGVLRTCTPAQLQAVAREHVLDWAFDNDDTHGENLVILKDATVVGIDKGRAWRYFGGWPGLTGDARANTNCALVYTTLYRLIREGAFPPEVVQRCYGAALAQARAMQYLPDATVETYIRQAVAHRPHFKPSSYQQPVEHAPSNADELVAAALTRKARLVEDIDAMWRRIYATAPEATGLGQPDTPSSVPTNPQGHVIHTSLHSPELHATVAMTKSLGTPVFLAGAHIRDAHVLLWRERLADTGTFEVVGELRLRGPIGEATRTWFAKHARHPAPTRLERNDAAHVAVVNAAKTISHHHSQGDTKYNPERLSELEYWRKVLQRIAPREHGGAGQAADYYSDSFGQRQAAEAMAVHYLSQIERLDDMRAKASGTTQPGDLPAYHYAPVLPDSQYVVTNERASRPANTRTLAFGQAALDSQRELQVNRSHPLINSTIDHYHGVPGYVGKLTLPTGESIQFRTDQVDRHSLRRQLTFRIPEAQLAAGLRRVTDVLDSIGVPLRPATDGDLELFYWRHLAGVMAERRDSARDKAVTRYRRFWQLAPDPDAGLEPDIELHHWRTAFATTTPARQLLRFRQRLEYLPHFMHQDLTRPHQPCGKPYWVRHDISAERCKSAAMPVCSYRSGPGYMLMHGAAMSSEARLRALAIWHNGQSSAEDQKVGSSAYVFLRQNLDENDGFYPTVWFNPAILRRTTNYAYPGDRYGRSGERVKYAFFEAAKAFKHTNGSNELLVHDSVSVLDDVELVAFRNASQREQFLTIYKDLGVHTIRGVPIEDRFLVVGDTHGRHSATRHVRHTWFSR